MKVRHEIKYVEEVQLCNILMSLIGDDIRSCKMCFLVAFLDALASLELKL